MVTLILSVLCSCSQTDSSGVTAEEKMEVSCNCVDGVFSSRNALPIAHSRIGKILVIFCGYKGDYYELDSIDNTQNNFGFKRTAFEIIQCSNDSVLVVVEEYYTDSIRVSDEGFKHFRLSHFPKAENLEYEPTTLLEYQYKETQDGIGIDTLIALPPKFFQQKYLNELVGLVEFYKNDTTDTSKYYDLKLHYLFLRALSDEKFMGEFISSGPYDGYMGPVFRDFKSYLGHERRKNGS
ncbi:hypothetical protein ADIS_0522 [Lunatimonas lonarensis]|uniref:Uncharacterized protein n=2 Tax=Lunatimonas lonarensis TaxID=1232681 RepID=R7ZY45_9BACT|nr:hypothetical protein ADIS_0522 [Lunatimonas lonarensis]